MADGLFYNDLREPFISSDLAAISPLATAVALYTPSSFPVLGGQYFARPGKALRVRLFGRCTSVLTPGNVSFAIYYGTGASANGVLLASSGAVAWSASQTNMSFMVEVDVTCRTTGSTGSLFCTGFAKFNVAAVASTLQPLLIPATAPVVSAACDLTAALIISVQMIRSGSTAETAQVHQMQVIALN
ncbi:hypothetical protein UFOVP891_60 [uncultured Caudovirales phage]|uniref:Uncharacterized protein n=1 Tax=uncultured Caudovirales phage TaxID=2100421 RepID=A0A6J5RE47_9CAUD|nr:hypothetical protein UFOVP472_7 [uncultured Caudovirales phage]CAB4169239.1 hypothetical protein UFOVP891_60 [uncultured Caudovirales phage]CAB4180747.1 hypothetical protein UFOVP1053_7 [uncultured Caudovirales phage]CAB4195299.1 hypothetical protein UFOVP1297_4 [uncultured Caudovirales phage]CAB4221908.1 hypothetical protein UFOVP1647_44 [uncultured Caudovirales phage]